jgi:hypothetical protein
MNRRALVLGDETARHPFRQSLPPHIRESALADAAKRAKRRHWQVTLGDWREFLAAYCASFVAVMVFIA